MLWIQCQMINSEQKYNWLDKTFRDGMICNCMWPGAKYLIWVEFKAQAKDNNCLVIQTKMKCHKTPTYSFLKYYHTLYLSLKQNKQKFLLMS